MKISAIKTYKITSKDKDLFRLLGKYVPKLPEKSVLAITSKTASVIEGRFIKMDKITKVYLKKRFGLENIGVIIIYNKITQM